MTPETNDSQERWGVNLDGLFLHIFNTIQIKAHYHFLVMFTCFEIYWRITNKMTHIFIYIII